MGEIFGNLGISWFGFLSQLINFAIVFFILRRFLYEPLFNAMDARKEQITSSLKDAERASSAASDAEAEKASILEDARREAQEVRAQATRDAEKAAQDVRTRADQEAADIVAKARDAAKSTADNALADVNKQVADLAIQATEKLLGRELENKADQKRFVTEFIKQGGS